ncbi:MAG: Uma2 family endonuclease, partial [Tychonema bourrellyi B0820]|nr:Uma2 family endonuclease [Tychonema bourrellyi B0820]
KWQVYEQILRVPYYIVFDGATNNLRAFVLTGDRYEELILAEPRVWMPEIQLGLGLWLGTFEGLERSWLRWHDAHGNWVPTPTEQQRQQKEAAQQEAEQAQQRAERLAERLRALGIDPDEL